MFFIYGITWVYHLRNNYCARYILQMCAWPWSRWNTTHRLLPLFWRPSSSKFLVWLYTSYPQPGRCDDECVGCSGFETQHPNLFGRVPIQWPLTSLEDVPILPIKAPRINGRDAKKEGGKRRWARNTLIFRAALKRLVAGFALSCHTCHVLSLGLNASYIICLGTQILTTFNRTTVVKKAYRTVPRNKSNECHLTDNYREYKIPTVLGHPKFNWTVVYWRGVVLLCNTIRKQHMTLQHTVTLSTTNLGTFAMLLTVQPRGYPPNIVEFRYRLAGWEKGLSTF